MRREHTLNILFNRSSSRWAMYAVSIFVVLSAFGGCIANEKPLYCKIEGQTYFPVVTYTLASVGMMEVPAQLRNSDWHRMKYDAVLFAPVAYSANTIDLRHANFEAPPGKTDERGVKFRHWLGTDNLGRDTLAGLIYGCRIALLIGLGSMLLAAMVGVPLGAWSGYYGNDRGAITVASAAIGGIAVLLGAYYAVRAITLVVATGFGRNAMIHLLLMLIIIMLAIVADRLAVRLRVGQKRLRMPWDAFVMRSIEVLRSIPAFFLLFAVLGIIQKPSVVYVVLLIALLKCPTVIRYVRAEALKLRDRTFIDAARVIGLSDRQIIYRHMIPNTLGPVFITMAFGIGGAVLLESGLSFLGIGLGVDDISWGKMLNTARTNFSAWWMAVFPGTAIFIVIAAFNRIGDVLTSIYEEG